MAAFGTRSPYFRSGPSPISLVSKSPFDELRMLGAAATHTQEIHPHTYTTILTSESQPPKPASFRDAEFAALCGGAGTWFLPARVWLCEDL